MKTDIHPEYQAVVFRDLGSGVEQAVTFGREAFHLVGVEARLSSP